MLNPTFTANFDKTQLIADPISLITYEVDAGFDRGRPDGIYFPRKTEDVARIMKLASQHKVPLIARGAGTGLSGCAVPEHGGVILSFAHMDRVLDFNPASRSAVVEPGVVKRIDARPCGSLALDITRPQCEGGGRSGFTSEASVGLQAPTRKAGETQAAFPLTTMRIPRWDSDTSAD